MQSLNFYHSSTSVEELEVYNDPDEAVTEDVAFDIIDLGELEDFASSDLQDIDA